MNKAIFLDRDGTINVDYGYVHEIEKFEFIDGVIEGLKILSDLGYLLIVITNQSGIARGFFTEEQFQTLNNYMLNKLEENNISIAKVYYCKHVDKDNCDCRKPKLGLFYKAIEEFDIDIDNSYAIGDKERDLLICKQENTQGILLTKTTQDGYICKSSLLEAAYYIQGNDRNV